MSPDAPSQKITHPVWGEGSLVRVEGTDWIVFFPSFGRAIRIPSEARGRLLAPRPIQPVPPQSASKANGSTRPPLSEEVTETESTPLASEISSTVPTAHGGFSPPVLDDLHRWPPLSATTGPTSEVRDASVKDEVPSPPKPNQLPPELNGFSSTWHMRRAIESLANGLPPSNTVARYLAVDFDVTNRMIGHFLSDVSGDGGGVLAVKGSYGQGKTFTLNCLEEAALSSGFLVMRAEADAKENRLNRPDQVYRNLMKSLRIPGYQGRGTPLLVNAVVSFLKSSLPDSQPKTWRTWLNGRIGCHHLEWLFSDPSIESKEELIGLLANRAGLSATNARASHCFKGIPTNWTALSDGTLGDFTCFLLSGIGRLAKLIGKQGLIIVIDEMEKWQDLDWMQQSRASSFICGLIWAATASTNRNRRSIKGLDNNRRFPGGSPFSTVERCSLGLAIAMTPRSEEDDPQQHWSKFGPPAQCGSAAIDGPKTS